MSELKFEVGKKYKHVSSKTVPKGISFCSHSGIFECHSVDDRDCWTMDAEYNGKWLNDGEGWCVASTMQLKTGKVIEVPE